MKERSLAFSRIFLCALACLCLAALLAPPSQAGDGAIIERAKAMVVGKGTDVLILGAHGFQKLNVHKLLVPYNPSIYDVGGNIMDLKDLKIPCEAYVTYRKDGNGEPVLSRLEMLLDYEYSQTHFNVKSLKDRMPE